MNGELPLGIALSHARGASPFSGDGAVMHRLANEVERMRAFMASRKDHSPPRFTELEVYDIDQARQLRFEQGFQA